VADKRQPSKPRMRKVETARERVIKEKQPKPRRLRRAAGTVHRHLKAVVRIGRKEYYIPLPDTRLGRFLNKRRRLVPRYFQESWVELRNVTWPSRKETFKLTVAVFTFAIILGALITVTDYGLEKIFRKLLLD